MHQIDADVALEVAFHEAIVRQAYLDSQNIWTFSVGITSASGHPVEQYINNPQPLEYCLRVYIERLRLYAATVNKAFQGVGINKAQFAAALSFHWNTGAIGRASWVRHFKADRIEEAKAAFMLWRNPPEIVKRREKERDLFFEGKWANDGTMLEYTRVRENGTPDWRSGKRIDVKRELQTILYGTAFTHAGTAI